MTDLAQQRPLVLHTRCVTGTGGGPEKTILNSPRFLARLGYNSACAYMHPPHDDGFCTLQQRAVEAGARLISLPDRGALDLRVVRRAIRLCREENVAIWHGHDYKSNALGLVVRRFWPMKLVTTVHGWVNHTRRTPLYYRIDKYCLRNYDEVVCVSRDLYDECLRIGVDQSRCHLVHNGIDVEQFRRSREPAAARECFAHKASGTLIGAMGRLAPEKGFDLLIRAVARLLDEGRDLSLWIAGDGAERENLQTLIEHLGCGERIRLLGHVAQTTDFFEALDVFALSSLREGLPNVLLEAMALATPVLATRIAGIPSLVDDGESGLLVEAGSVEELSQGLRRLLDDAPQRARMASAARRTIEGSFSFEQRMRKMAAVYDGLLAGTPAVDARETVRA